MKKIVKLITQKTVNDGDINAPEFYECGEAFAVELEKFICPVRFVKFLNENTDKYIILNSYKNEIKENVVIDMSAKVTELHTSKYKFLLLSPLGVQKYIDETCHLDIYGNEASS